MEKNPPANAGDMRDAGSVPGSRRSPGEGHGNPLQYSCLENPMDRGAWRATVQAAAKIRTWLKWLSTHMHRMWAFEDRYFVEVIHGCDTRTIIEPGAALAASKYSYSEQVNVRGWRGSRELESDSKPTCKLQRIVTRERWANCFPSLSFMEDWESGKPDGVDFWLLTMTVDAGQM